MRCKEAPKRGPNRTEGYAEGALQALTQRDRRDTTCPGQASRLSYSKAKEGYLFGNP